MEVDDAEAILQLGYAYFNGDVGLEQDHEKAMELWLRARKLGCASAYYSLGIEYFKGEDVAYDFKKAKYYWELAAMGGHVLARQNVGDLERQTGDMSRAVKHYTIAAGVGHDNAIEALRKLNLNGQVAKDDFEKALCAHKEASDEMKSGHREEAAAANAAGEVSWAQF